MQINQLKSERKDTNAHISKMEDEIKSLRALLSHVLNTTNIPRPYHPLQHTASFNERDFARASMSPQPQQQPHRPSHRQSLNLNYGTINHDDTLGFATEQDIIRPMHQQFNDIRKAEKLKYSQNNGKHVFGSAAAVSSENHQTRPASFGGAGDSTNYATQAEHEQNDGHIVQMEKDTLGLRRELQDALASKKSAESKILA